MRNRATLVLTTFFCLHLAAWPVLAKGSKYSQSSKRGVAAAHQKIQPVEIRDVYVIHFIIDGTNLKTFNRALAQGRLPTIHKHFVERGARFERATSNFPSTSSTVYQSFVTGLLPGHAGIPHLERFDRQRLKAVDYLSAGSYEMLDTDLINLRALINPEQVELEPPTTIFELLRGHPTAAIYTSFRRGATIKDPKKAPFHGLWSAYVSQNEEHVDVLPLRETMQLFKGLLEKIPRYSLVGLYAADVLGHRYGPYSQEVVDALIQFDLFLRDFFDLLNRRGLADKTYIIISADHGMHTTGRLFKFRKALEEKGVFVKPKNPRIKDYTLFAATRGVASSHLYVRHDGGFEPLTDPDVLRRHPTRNGRHIDLIEFILGLDATNLLIVRAGERRARIYNREGKSADVSCYTLNFEDYCSYRFDRQRGDPLGYAKNPSLRRLLDGRPHSTLAWREATAAEQYPDAVIQLSQIFHDGRGGDAFISTHGRYGFQKVKAGNHGGATEEDMRVPLLIAGPTVPRGTFGVIRPADVYPLLLKWFGLSVPEGNHEGVNPFDRFEGEKPRWQKLASLEQVVDERRSRHKTIDFPQFVRKEIYPITRAAQFPGILRLARDELKRRSKLTVRLGSLLAALRAQQVDRKAPKVVGKRYLEDHIDIVERTLRWAEQGERNMQDIVAILSRCRVAGSAGCRQLQLDDSQ
jgi:hypothetical protein